MQQLRSAIHNAIARFLKNQPPARIIAVGFALLILLGAALLMLGRTTFGDPWPYTPAHTSARWTRCLPQRAPSV